MTSRSSAATPRLGRRVGTRAERSAGTGVATGARPLLGYLGALAGLEWLLTISVPAAAAGFGLLAIGACVTPPRDRRGAALLPVLVALPVTRLVVVATPTGDASPLQRAGLVAAVEMIVVALALRASPLERLAPPRRRRWRVQAAVVLVGVPLAVVVARLGPPVPPLPRGIPAVVAAAVLALAVVPDEVLFRGLLVPGTAVVLRWAAVPVSAGVWAATYLAYGSVTVICVVFGTGLVLGWLRERTGSAVGVIGARILLVLLVGLVLPALS